MPLAAPSAPARETPTPRRPPTDRFAWSLEAGYAYQNMYSTPSNGVDLLAVIGASFPRGHVRVGGVIGATFSTTTSGVHTSTTSLGALAEWYLGPVRLGCGARFGTLDVVRATDGSVFVNLTAGIFARASMDLFAFDKEGSGALFVVAKAGLDTVPTFTSDTSVATGLYSMGGAVGARF
jgi:hypothetical protein